MKKTLAVARRELSVSLDSPVAWVAGLVFVLSLHAAFFFVGHPVGDLRLPSLWAGRVASLDALFAWLPLAFAIVAPALTMGQWAEERRSGTDELLFTWPVSLRALVVGKFLAAWALLGFLTFLTVLSAALMVASLGPLDWGTVLGGVVGALGLAAVSVAVGSCASALTSEDLVAFLVAALVLGLLWAAGLFVRAVPGPLAEALWAASPALHFLDSGARGLFDARDVVYFALWVACGLGGTLVLLEGRRWAGSQTPQARTWRTNAWISVALGAALWGGGNRWAQRALSLRLDLSEDGLYAPSPIGERMLHELDDVLSVRAYFTGRSRLGPVQIAKRRLVDQLVEFEGAAQGRMDLRFVDPNESAEARAEAVALGIQPVPMTAFQGTSQVTQDTWLGLVLRYRGRERVVPFVLPQGLEYAFLSALRQLTRETEPVVGILAGKGDGASDPFTTARGLLKDSYRLREVLDLEIGEEVPNDVSVLVVARPRGLHPRAAFAVDQFVQRGGRVLVLLDPTAVDLRGHEVSESNTGLEGVLDAWGVTVSEDLVWDQSHPNALQLSAKVRLGDREERLPKERLPYPFWIHVERDGLDRSNPVTARLGSLDLFWAHALEASAPPAGLEPTVLVSSSEASWLVPKEEALVLDRDALQARAVGLTARGGGRPRPLALALAGRFPSGFEGGAPAPRDPLDEVLRDTREGAPDRVVSGPDARSATTGERVLSREARTQVVLVGDADWIADGPYASPQNRLFFNGLIDWLALENDLLALRSRFPRERRLRDFLVEERRALGLSDLLLQGDESSAGELAGLEARARERAARRRHLRMAAASAGAILCGLFVRWFALLSLRRGR